MSVKAGQAQLGVLTLGASRPRICLGAWPSEAMPCRRPPGCGLPLRGSWRWEDTGERSWNRCGPLRWCCGFWSVGARWPSS